MAIVERETGHRARGKALLHSGIGQGDIGNQGGRARGHGVALRRRLVGPGQLADQ